MALSIKNDEFYAHTFQNAILNIEKENVEKKN